MANLKVKLYSPGMVEMMKSEKVKAELHRIAERAASAARASAPVKSGAYLAGIEVVDEVHKDRVVSRVYAKAPDSMFVEANTGNLARALDGGNPNRLLDYTTKSGKKRKATQAQIDNWTRGSR